jgi:hypothetical protein
MSFTDTEIKQENKIHFKQILMCASSKFTEFKLSHSHPASTINECDLQSKTRHMFLPVGPHHLHSPLPEIKFKCYGDITCISQSLHSHF